MQHDYIRTARDSNDEIRTICDAVIILTSRSKPTPSDFLGERFMHASGASRREIADSHLKLERTALN
jgi:hypothetical protein